MAGLQFIPNAQALKRSVEVFISDAMNPQLRSQILAKFAMEDVAEMIATGRASPVYQVFVDGVEGADPTSVDPDGQIFYDFSYTSEAVAFAIAFLRRRAPRKSGQLAESFWISIDGKFLPSVDAVNLDHIPRDAEIIIGNSAPYARKADIQLVGTHRLHFNAPPFMYADCVRAMRIRFGNAFGVKRVHTIHFPGQYILKGTKRRGQRVNSPAIIINPKGN